MLPVTGRKHTRKGTAAPRLRGAKELRFRVAWKNKMAINQNTTIRVTFFPEDIKVGQDVMRVAAMSREILAFDGQNRRPTRSAYRERADQERFAHAFRRCAAS